MNTASSPHLAPVSLAAGTSDPWRVYATWLGVTALVLFAVLAFLCVALDPYDTGRFALLRSPGTVDRGPRSANASRARDSAFDGAVIGNSHIQLVSPASLGDATGIPFASLIVPATGPGEQLIVLDYYLRRRLRPARALVIGTDGTWCTGNPALPFWKPFPAWLYDASPWTYLVGLLRYDTLKRLPRRVALAAGRARRMRADGYWDYEEYRVWRAEAVMPILERRDVSTVPNTTGRFPALDALASRLDRLPPGVAAVLVRPPVYVNTLPEPGTEAARSDEGCRQALLGLAATRPNVRIVDWRIDRPEVREPQNFFDMTHYRAPVARAMEADIATAIRGAQGL